MRQTLVAIAVVLGCSLPAAAVPPSASASAAPKDWLDQWQSATQRLIEVAEAMPEQKYGYRPTKDVNTFADQLKHTMLATRVLLANAEGHTASPKDPAIEKLASKAEIIAMLHEVAAQGAGVIGRVAAKSDGEVVQSQFFGKTTRRFLLIQAIAHDNNHYGQLVFYLRLNGIVPPASRK